MPRRDAPLMPAAPAALNLQIVPYVDTVAVHSPPLGIVAVGPSAALTAWISKEAAMVYIVWANSFTLKILMFMAAVMRVAFVWLPFLFVWCYMFWIVSAAAHIAQNPEVLAKGTFSMVASVPEYTFWAFGRMAKEFCASAVAYWR